VFIDSIQATQQRDIEKKEACRVAGITLIQIPYWWNRRKESLAATIHLVRRELLSEFRAFDPIPESPPVKKKYKTKAVVPVNEGMYINDSEICTSDVVKW
jgi:hypothetical protein